MSTNVMVRNVDIEGGNPTDARRLEIVVDGLTIFDGAQLAIDTTMVSPAAGRDGAQEGGGPQWREMVGERGRARFVVLGAEVGGTWSGETAEFLAALSKAKAESAPENVRDEVRRAWLRRWRNLLSCTAARALATSLLERRTFPGVTSAVPAEHEVLRESRFF